MAEGKKLSRSERRQKRLANLRRRVATYLPHRLARMNVVLIEQFLPEYGDLLICDLEPTCPTLDKLHADLFTTNLPAIMHWWLTIAHPSRDQLVIESANAHAPMHLH
jgi:hypothetical protein